MPNRDDDKPILHILAGPNGAGKSTLYEFQLKQQYSDVEFVNADNLAKQHYGHPAHTLTESQTGAIHCDLASLCRTR